MVSEVAEAFVEEGRKEGSEIQTKMLGCPMTREAGVIRSTETSFHQRVGKCLWGRSDCGYGRIGGGHESRRVG